MNSTAIADKGGEITEVKLECHLEVKSEDSCGKTLTFEFSYPDVDPDEISHEFVSISRDILQAKSNITKMFHWFMPKVYYFRISIGWDKLYQRAA